jgi:hypothetical protein
MINRLSLTFFERENFFIFFETPAGLRLATLWEKRGAVLGNLKDIGVIHLGKSYIRNNHFFFFRSSVT